MNPSIGRVVWVNSPVLSDQLCAAMVTYVHSPSLVNLVVFDRNGDASPQMRVDFYHGNDGLIPTGAAGWMPYQIAVESKRNEPSKSDELLETILKRLDAQSHALELQAKQISELKQKLAAQSTEAEKNTKSDGGPPPQVQAAKGPSIPPTAK